MKLPVSLQKTAARYNQLSLRERALVSGALFIAVVMIWTLAFFDPATATQNALRGEIVSLQESIGATVANVEGTTGSETMRAALAREGELKHELEQLNARLASEQAGLIEPERMVQVIHDVLSRQRGVRLVSLHNKPRTSLVPPKPPAPVAASADATAAQPDGAAETDPGATPVDLVPEESGPYVHPVELVVEGEYLDVLAYLHALEQLPWRFYWKLLDLKTTKYPVNRVRVELATLSMDKDWIGM